MYGSWQAWLVVAVLVLFAAIVLWRYRPELGPGALPPFGRKRRHSPDVEARIRDALERARKASTSRGRSEALTAAGDAAALAPDGDTSALGFYLRAMRVDATYVEPVRGVSALLAAEQPEVLEAVLWRRLSHLSLSGETHDVAKSTLLALAELYKRQLRHRPRARALTKLAARL